MNASPVIPKTEEVLHSKESEEVLLSKESGAQPVQSGPDEAMRDEQSENWEDKRGHKGRERRCIATGSVRDIAEMVRFVLDPDKRVIADIAGKLPGRGVWVSADKASLDKAISEKAFAKGFKTKCQLPDDLQADVARLLKRRVLGLLTMAMKAGQMANGFDQVKSAAQSGPLAYRIEALDGSGDGRGKIRVLSKAIGHEFGLKMAPVIGCFNAKELGAALGREHIVHGAIRPGGFARSLRQDVVRLAGFVDIIPQNWPDKSHETIKIKMVNEAIRG